MAKRKKEFSDNGYWAVQMCSTFSSLPLIPALWTLCWGKLKVGIHWYFFWDNDHYVCTYLWGGKQVNVHFDMTYGDRAGDFVSMWALCIMYPCEYCMQCTILIYTFGKIYLLIKCRFLTFIYTLKLDTHWQ